MHSYHNFLRYLIEIFLGISVALLASCAEIKEPTRQSENEKSQEKVKSLGEFASVKNPKYEVTNNLRGFLEDRDALINGIFNDQGNKGLLKIIFSTPSECGFMAPILDSQLPIIIPGGFYLFGVKFPSDKPDFCASAPDPGICLSLQGNCLASDQSIFCDVGLFKRLLFEAHEAYFRIHLSAATQANKGKLIEEHIPSMDRDFMIALADYQQGKLSQAGSQSEVLPDNLGGVENYSQIYSSLSKDLMELFLIYIVIGHEYAHVEQHNCPIDTETLIPDMKGLLDQYTELTCSTTNRKEFAADLRGIDLSLRGTKEMLKDSGERRTEGREIPSLSTDRPLIPASIELKALQRLDKTPHLLMISALQESAEYETIMGRDPGGNRALIEKEPLLNTAVNTALLQYYFQVAKDDGGIDDTHMLPAVRSLILMSKIHALAKTEAHDEIIIHANRFYGAMLGQLVAVQMKRCTPPVFAPRTRDEAFRRAQQFIYSIYAPNHRSSLVP